VDVRLKTGIAPWQEYFFFILDACERLVRSYIWHCIGIRWWLQFLWQCISGASGKNGGNLGPEPVMGSESEMKAVKKKG